MKDEKTSIILGLSLIGGVLAVGIIALRWTIEREVRRVDSSIKALPAGLVTAIKG